MTRKWLLLFSALLPLGAAAVELRDAYVRGLPPGQKNTAAFFQLHNPAGEPVTLRAGSSEAAERVEIHRHIQRNGMMAMQREDALQLAPGQRVDFAPGGYHLMLVNLRRPLRDGDSVSFTLVSDDGQTLSVEAPVRSVLSETGHGHHRHHGGAQ